MMEKPLMIITGVSGRLGSLAASQFSQNYHVIGLDIQEPKEKLKGCDFIFTDISSLENVKDSFATIREKFGNTIASFIHLAAYYNFEGGKWEMYQKITINGTENILNALDDFELEQFLFSSTLLVYAPCKKGEKIHENSPVDPKWEYPLSKVKTEELIRKKTKKGSHVILRIAGIYEDGCNSIPISQHIHRIYKKKLESHFFPGNPTHGSSFLHNEDFISALKLIVDKRRELDREELFVLGEPTVMSYQELQDAIGNLLYQKNWFTIRIPKWFAKMGAILKDALPFFKKSFIKPWMIDLADDHYDVDITKARKILGWEPKHSLKKSLPKMIETLKKDPKKWFQKHGL